MNIYHLIKLLELTMLMSYFQEIEKNVKKKNLKLKFIVMILKLRKISRENWI